jgi:hypothetical protein
MTEYLDRVRTARRCLDNVERQLDEAQMQLDVAAKASGVAPRVGDGKRWPREGSLTCVRPATTQ